MIVIIKSMFSSINMEAISYTTVIPTVIKIASKQDLPILLPAFEFWFAMLRPFVQFQCTTSPLINHVSNVTKPIPPQFFSLWTIPLPVVSSAYLTWDGRQW